MAGRTKQKVYQYNLFGKFIQTYESISRLRSVYFSDDNGKRPIFTGNKNYRILDDNTIISTKKLGRMGIREVIKRENSPYLNLGQNIKEIEVYNLNNVLVATFASAYIASKITNIPYGTIENRVNKGTKHGNTDTLWFKYKN